MIVINQQLNTNPYLNLALEEYLVRHADCGEQDYVLFYVNEPSIVIGKNQSIYKEVNFEYLRSKSLQLARRISGGGTVYHDTGNLCFAFISAFTESKINNYRFFNQPIIDALNTIGVPAEADDRNNILCKGKKISGSAQFTNRKNIVSHGTLLFNANKKVLGDCLRTNNFAIETKAVDSVKSPIANITDYSTAATSVEGLKQYLLSHLQVTDTYELSSAQWKEVNELANTKFKTYEWVYGRSPHTKISRNGVVLEIENGVIASCIATNVALLPGTILPDVVGLKYNYNAVEQKLTNDEQLEWLDFIF